MLGCINLLIVHESVIMQKIGLTALLFPIARLLQKTLNNHVEK